MDKYTQTEEAGNAGKMDIPWDVARLEAPPRMYPAAGFETEGVTAIFYDGLPYRGSQTRVFAYYGIPKEVETGKVPAVVLVHGGGGTSFPDWVRQWTARGYAAMAIDVEGHTPGAKDANGQYPGHVWSGPSRQNIFADYRLPLEDQWMYHAGADVMLANSLLRSFAEVDQERVGITGISWGGIITSVVSGADDRFAFSIPVYGCGYLFESENQYQAAFAEMKEHEERVRKLWDPSAYLTQARIPMLWVNGTNDGHFPLTIFSKSYETAKRNNPATTLSILPGMRHNHASGWEPEVIYAFANSIVKGGRPFLRVEEQSRDGRHAAARLSNNVEPAAAQLLYTNTINDWPAAEWLSTEAFIMGAAGTIRAEIPEEAKAYFFLIEDRRGLTVSTPLAIIR